MTRESPALSLVILTWNSKAFIPDLLESIEYQRFRDFETIVVDNGSTDGTPDWIKNKAPEVRLFRNRKNRGFCRGMNRGVREARGEFVLLLNADLTLDPECLFALMQVAKAGLPGFGGVFPCVLFKDAPLFINAFGVDWHERAHWRDGRVGMFHRNQKGHPERVFGSIFPAVLIRRDIFLESRGFDPMFFSYNEDFDLSYRLNILGFRWYIAPNALMDHHYQVSIKSKKAERAHHALFVRNYLAVFFKNYEFPSLKKEWKYILYRYVGAPVRNAIRQKDWRSAWPPIKGLLGFILRLPIWFIKRRSIQKKRQVRDSELWSTAPIEEFNLFHYNGDLVMSVLNLRASRGNPVNYEAGGSKFTTS